MSYTYTEKIDGRGMAVQFDGPGLSHRGYDDIVLKSSYDADRVASMLHRAYEAGRHAQAKEIRRALGVHDGPWGVKVGDPVAPSEKEAT